jgi:RNA polymerase sigma factor (TIGR02999 family)
VNSDLSALVASADQGDHTAADALFAALYDELHRMARRELARRGGHVTLGATALLHEVYLDISGRDRVMRGLIIDYARRRQAQKRGGQFEITSSVTDVAAGVPDADRLGRLSDALDELERADARLARVVDLKFFCGFAFTEIAAMVGASERTVQRDWEKARIYLHRVLREDFTAG